MQRIRAAIAAIFHHWATHALFAVFLLAYGIERLVEVIRAGEFSFFDMDTPTYLALGLILAGTHAAVTALEAYFRVGTYRP